MFGLTLAALQLAAATPAQAATPTPVIPPDGPVLTAQIRAADQALFALVFDRCDPAALTRMVAPDFEMYHDKGGFTNRDGASFVADYAKSCAARQAPDAWRSRRTLVPGSLFVQAIPGYGALEEGDHEFWERQGDGPERKVGAAHFVQLWRKADADDDANGTGGWRLSRVLSYRHRAVESKAK